MLFACDCCYSRALCIIQFVIMCNDGDVLSCLCIDIKRIVYRYVFDANYREVKYEYKVNWLRGDDIHGTGIYWSNIFSPNEYFSDGNFRIANWRTLSGGVSNGVLGDRRIYTFKRKMQSSEYRSWSTNDIESVGR